MSCEHELAIDNPAASNYGGGLFLVWFLPDRFGVKSETRGETATVHKPDKRDMRVEVERFLAEMLPKLEAADTALHNGDAAGRIAAWSQHDPLTLFGAAVTRRGWAEIGPTFNWLASRFSNCTSFDCDVIAADVSGDLAYIVGIEHTTASAGGAAPTPYSLRVTTIFRREGGEWKVVHRHGDPIPEESATTRDQLDRLIAE